MSTMQIKVVNQSKHDFEFIDQFGTSINDIQYKWDRGTKVIDRVVPIPAGSTTEIGWIEVPSVFPPSQGNWGWWYVQDTKNQATFELYAYCDPIHDDKHSASIGLLTSCHDRGNPTPNPVPKYLEWSRDGKSFNFTIKSAWTDDPPGYVFNYGHYGIAIVTEPVHGVHTYLVVKSCFGEETIEFPCWGGTQTGPSSDPDVHYPAQTFLGGVYELALARTISCFNAEDIRNMYKDDDNRTLGLGDCSGIIYGRTGVCHQMANRICAAVTNIDVGDRADMTFYNPTQTYWGPYGGKPNPDTPKTTIDAINLVYKPVVTDDELRDNNISPSSPYPVNYLFKPWNDYFAECKRLVRAAYYYETKPLVALEVKSGDVIDAVTPVFAKQVKGDRCGGAGGQETRLEKAGYVITGMDIYRGRYFSKPVIAQLQVIWHRLTPSGIDSTDEIISARVGSGTDVEGLTLNKLRTTAGKFISKLSASAIAVDGRTFLADIDIEQEAGIASLHESPPLVGLEVRHGYVIDAITPIFTETVKGCQYGGTGGNVALLEKAGYVITGIDVWRGSYFGKKVIAQLQVIWHKLTPVGIDSAHEIISNKLGSGNHVTDLQCEKLRAGPGNYIHKMDADGSSFLEDILVTREKLI